LLDGEAHEGGSRDPALEGVAHVDAGELLQGGAVALVAQEREPRAEVGAPGQLPRGARRGALREQRLAHLGGEQRLAAAHGEVALLVAPERDEEISRFATHGVLLTARAPRHARLAAPSR